VIPQLRGLGDDTQRGGPEHREPAQARLKLSLTDPGQSS